LKSLRQRRPVEVAIEPDDVERLLAALRGMTLSQARQVLAYCLLEDGKLSGGDIRVAIDRKAQLVREGGLLEYYPAEENRYEIGGFQRLKDWLERARLGFSKEAKELNLQPPRGILIVGVQGCGKSLAAKAIAKQWELPLLKLDAGRLFDKYIGESEKNFRKAIALAEAMAPAVLWIDEIEKGMAPSSMSESDGGLSRRLFGSFLTWLQEKRHEVFVVATANDISILPPELLRKGRFDEVFFVDLPDAGERRAIFEIHLKLRKQDPARFEVERLIEAADGFSGAEIEQAVIAGLYRALHHKRPLDTELLLEEIRGTVPLSVSRREDVEGLRAFARGRFVPVR
jgi:SpoVK/Ycf46/Vps4 family AAA+-type ATPase